MSFGILKDLVREVGAHRVAMGTCGLGSPADLFLGSVAAKVFRLAHVAVTLVK